MITDHFHIQYPSSLHQVASTGIFILHKVEIACVEKYDDGFSK